MEEIKSFYEGYIAAFNAGDAEAFAAYFHTPTVIMRGPRPNERGQGWTLPSISDPRDMLRTLPARWKRSTIDAITTVDAAAPFVARPELHQAQAPRMCLVTTVTRWDAEDRPYQQLQAMYVLSRQDGRLGIKFLTELASADLLAG